MNIFRALADLLFPPHREVYAARRVTEERLFTSYALSYDSTLNVYTALPYTDDAVRALIRTNKYFAEPHAATLLSTVLEEALGAIIEERRLEQALSSVMIVPIPLSAQRSRERGHNQVARVLRRINDLSLRDLVNEHALHRHDRKSQARIQKSERATNIAGAFFVRASDAKRVAGKTIILVDDVCESGSTLKDARRALREAGAHNVISLALAR